MMYIFLNLLGSLILVSIMLWLLFEGFLSPEINTVFRDRNFLVISKEHDLRINSNDSTVKTVETYLRRKYPELVNASLCHNFYFVHRLDYATSGIMCIPLNKGACKVIAKAFKERTTQKYYLAVLRGIVSKELLDVNISIGEDAHNKLNQKMCTIYNKNCINSRTARTTFLVLEYGFFYDYPATKVLIRPITGRRHQIRVHSAYLGHHIVGDFTYSNKKDTSPIRMYLHALRLVLPNPITDLDVETEDPFLLDGWESYHILNKLDRKAFKKLDRFVCDILVESSKKPD